MADSEVRQKEWTILETERLIRKIEQCEGMPAKLILMRHFYEAGMRAGEIARSERSDKDYAIEHAEYLAKAAEAFLRVSNERAKAAEESEDVEDLMNADELLSDHRRALNSAIYEFRKRANRALPAAPEEKKWKIGFAEANDITYWYAAVKDVGCPNCGFDFSEGWPEMNIYPHFVGSCAERIENLKGETP